MDKPVIEIHDVFALRVDAAGRIGLLRVIGVADQADQDIHVEAGTWRGEVPSLWWDGQGADASARTVDPARTTGYRERDFMHDTFRGEHRQAHLWVAEIDLLASHAPPIVIGRQPVPLNVRARYLSDGDTQRSALRTFPEIRPIEEFDVGVLFVHGIGQQRRAETLVQWSAPLLRWINAWLSGATDEIASKLPSALIKGSDEITTKDLHELLQGWRNSLVVRPNNSPAGPDYGERVVYAHKLADKAMAPTFQTWRDELEARLRTQEALGEQRYPTPEEKSAASQVIGALGGLKVSAVGGSAEFRDAYILDVGTHSVDPSSVEVHVQAMAPDGYMLRSRWMLAESHWAETFWAPSFSGFSRWCLRTVPILLVHYIGKARDRHPMWLRWIVSVFGFAVALTLAQLSLLLLTVLRLVPWQRSRAGMLRLLLGFTGVVGDSYVLLEDPVQRRAILDRMKRDLEWLERRCRKVVLIAHSQGASITERVLSARAYGAGRVDSIAALGAGVDTLGAIQALGEDRGARTAGWVVMAGVLLLGGAAAFAMMRNQQMALVLAAVAVVVVIWAAEWRAVKIHRRLRPRWSAEPWRWRWTWFDFLARRDFVPYGPFAIPEHKRYRPKEVRNRDSHAADHITYWENAEQVVGPIARLIGRAAGFKPLSELLPNDEATLLRLGRSRLSRLRFLHAARFVMLLATAMLLATNWDAWFAIGFWALAWVEAKLGLAIDVVRVPELVVWLQMLIVFVPLVVHKSLLSAIYDGWATVEVERLLRRSAGEPSTLWAAIFTTVLVIVLVGTIEYLWPMNWPVVAATMAASAIVSGWIARNVHLKQTDAPDAAKEPV